MAETRIKANLKNRREKLSQLQEIVATGVQVMLSYVELPDALALRFRYFIISMADINSRPKFHIYSELQK